MTSATTTPTQTALGPLRQIEAGLLDVGYVEAGPADGPAVLLLHGWPYDIHSYADVTPLLTAKGYRVIVPYLRGYGTTRFVSDETFRNGQQAAMAMDAISLLDALDVDRAIVAGFDWGARTAVILAAIWPERVKALVAVSGYIDRWRLKLAEGERDYDGLEQQLFGRPVIGVPSITIGSDFDGAAADGAAYASQFSGPYTHRILLDIGHNVPQEAPQPFAEAVLEVDTY
jgi:pimeloyl-ACP methyl ester carboxylesterase